MLNLRHVHLISDARQKKHIRDVVKERGLTSYMNDTKWRELCHSIDDLPFRPAYQVKYVHADRPEPLELQHAPNYLGDWASTPEASFGLHIEWVKIAPRYSERRGHLISPVVRDCSSELIALLRKLRLPFVEEDGFVTLYGHGSASTFI
jgi:hypothetical protein